MKYIVLIIDEITELRENPDSFDDLNRLVRMGRNSGIRVIVATQKPSGAMFKAWTETRDLFDARVCFYIGQNSDYSQIALGKGDTSGVDVPNIPGRGLWKHEKKIMFHSMYLNAPNECMEILNNLMPKGDENANLKKMLPPR